MRISLNFVSGLTAITLITYLYILVTRTIWFSRAAAVGADVAWIVAALCVIGLVCPMIAIQLSPQTRWLPILAMIIKSDLSGA